MNLKSHNKGKKLPPEPLTKDEVSALLATCSRKASSGMRDRALIAVLWRGQVRISEALSLRPADFDAMECTLRILHGKGDKSRVVAIDHGTVEILNVWMERRKSLGFNGVHPIFCSLKGKELASSQVREMLPRRAKKAGIGKRVHAHGLRHTGASELIAENVPLMEIQGQLGHSSPATTARYLHNLNPKERIARLRTRSW